MGSLIFVLALGGLVGLIVGLADDHQRPALVRFLKVLGWLAVAGGVGVLFAGLAFGIWGVVISGILLVALLVFLALLGGLISGIARLGMALSTRGAGSSSKRRARDIPVGYLPSDGAFGSAPGLAHRSQGSHSARQEYGHLAATGAAQLPVAVPTALPSVVRPDNIPAAGWLGAWLPAEAAAGAVAVLQGGSSVAEDQLLGGDGDGHRSTLAQTPAAPQSAAPQVPVMGNDCD